MNATCNETRSQLGDMGRAGCMTSGTGGRVGQVAGGDGKADPLRQFEGQRLKLCSFPREYTPSRQFIWRAEGGGAMRKG